MGLSVFICADPESAGNLGAAIVAAELSQALEDRPRARLLLSTGASQFETLSSLVRRPVDWKRVDAFHLDEYVGLGAEHSASFRRYLRERVENLVPLRMHYVDPDDTGSMLKLAESVRAQPMDVALIGVGQNGHLAFNDPPADFNTTEPYITVSLDEACRAQQVGEGWFATSDDVPAQAISMSVHEIMRARSIVSVVPHDVKAQTLVRLLSSTEVTPDLPASMLHRHPHAQLVTDIAGAHLLPEKVRRRCVVL